MKANIWMVFAKTNVKTFMVFLRLARQITTRKKVIQEQVICPRSPRN